MFTCTRRKKRVAYSFKDRATMFACARRKKRVRFMEASLPAVMFSTLRVRPRFTWSTCGFTPPTQGRKQNFWYGRG